MTDNQLNKIIDELQFFVDIYLHDKQYDDRYEKVALHVINNTKFRTQVGSADRHHAYLHGLLVHTHEVVNNARFLALGAPDELVNHKVLIMAAIWHDFHKIYEYSHLLGIDIKKLPYREEIGHITGSVIEFNKIAIENHLDPDFILKVTHCMLAHHGKLEWRSPVTPQTREAWLLHIADNLSAQGLNPGVK